MNLKNLLSIKILILTLFSFFLTSCYDAVEIDDEVYGLMIGIDKGIKNTLVLTVQYPIYKEGGSGGGGDGGGGGGESGGGTMEESFQQTESNIHAVEASTILQGLDILGMEISRRISLKHAKAIIFSEEFAREGIANYLAPILRYRETRQTMRVIVTNTKAETFIKNYKVSIGNSLSKSIELMSEQSENTGYFPPTTFSKFYSNIISPYASSYAIYAGISQGKETKESPPKNPPFIPEVTNEPGEYPARGVSQREFSGTAVFLGDKMVGSLNPDETRAFLMVIGDFQRGFITLEDELKENHAIVIETRLGRTPKIKTSFQDGVPIITIDLFIEGDLSAVQSRINYEEPKLLGNLENRLANHIKSEILKTIKKTQTEMKSDIFGFGHYIATHFSTIQAFEKYNWDNHYEEAKIHLQVDTNIRRSGLQIESTPIQHQQGPLQQLDMD
jgi:Ger(x)C family germination protein